MTGTSLVLAPHVSQQLQSFGVARVDTCQNQMNWIALHQPDGDPVGGASSIRCPSDFNIEVRSESPWGSGQTIRIRNLLMEFILSSHALT